MGKLIYGQGYEIEFEDRALQHLQIVISSKLRRGESFSFGWAKSVEIGSGRTTIWMHPAVPLVYEYHGNRPPTINQAWLEKLMQTANSAGGLQLVPEPAAAEGQPTER
jgi:hypothetical protein